MYAIIKVDVTGLNDINKPHGNIITIWWTSAIKVTTLLKKKSTFRNEKIVPQGHSLTSLSKPRDRFFYLSLTPMIDSYILNPCHAE